MPIFLQYLFGAACIFITIDSCIALIERARKLSLETAEGLDEKHPLEETAQNLETALILASEELEESQALVGAIAVERDDVVTQLEDLRNALAPHIGNYIDGTPETPLTCLQRIIGNYKAVSAVAEDQAVLVHDLTRENTELRALLAAAKKVA